MNFYNTIDIISANIHQITNVAGIVLLASVIIWIIRGRILEFVDFGLLDDVWFFVITWSLLICTGGLTMTNNPVVRVGSFIALGVLLLLYVGTLLETRSYRCLSGITHTIGTVVIVATTVSLHTQ